MYICDLARHEFVFAITVSRSKTEGESDCHQYKRKMATSTLSMMKGAQRDQQSFNL